MPYGESPERRERRRHAPQSRSVTPSMHARGLYVLLVLTHVLSLVTSLSLKTYTIVAGCYSLLAVVVGYLLDNDGRRV